MGLCHDRLQLKLTELDRFGAKKKKKKKKKKNFTPQLFAAE